MQTQAFSLPFLQAITTPMLIRLDQFSRQTQMTIRQFFNMRPVPQLPSWLACAEQFKAKGQRLEAAVIMDLIALKYGRETARKQLSRASGISVEHRGRGAGFAAHGLEHGYPPVCLMGSLYSAVGERITCCNILDGWKNTIDLTPARKTGLRLAHVRLSSAAYTLLAAVGETLYKIENNELLPIMTLNQKIIGLSEGLDSGELLVLKEAVAPILAPDCVLVRNLDRHPEVVELPNIEQRLNGDCVACDVGWMTCCGGMQNTEVRFIHRDGSWETRFAHDKRVLRVARSECGPVSLDASGQAFLWQNKNVIDDCHFALDKLPAEVMEHITDFQAGVDWKRGLLYLNGKGTHIQEVPAWRVCAENAVSNAFVRQIYPSPSGLCTALLGDGHYHFWNLNANSVVVDWQLPETVANGDDWRALLDNRFHLSVEDDPRIRKIIMDNV